MAEEKESAEVRVLVIDDEPDIANILRKIIRSAGRYVVDVQTSRFNVAAHFAASPPDVVFVDLVMPDMDGFEVLQAVREINPDVPVVVISAHSTVENAVRAVKCGAFDFVAKPFDPEAIELILAKLDRELALLERTRSAQREDPYLKTIKGQSPAIRQLRDWIAKVRGVNASVLLQGESGTGKELVARAIHSGRGPFVAINMAAIPDELAESELFGHRQGAFTGAMAERQGLLVEANGGTLFLDEVNAMSPVLQAKLLRVIQERRVRPVGSNKEIAVEFRLISATNEDLEAAVQQGRFRRDLYHRLRVLNVTLPPLRDRREDIPLLADEFVQHYARAHGCRVRRISRDCLERLARREWPGNIRELENLIEEAVILCPEDVQEIRIDRWACDAPGAEPEQGDRIKTLAEVERDYVREILAVTEGNKARAARLLDIDYKTLLRKIDGPP